MTRDIDPDVYSWHSFRDPGTDWGITVVPRKPNTCGHQLADGPLTCVRPIGHHDGCSYQSATGSDVSDQHTKSERRATE